MTTLTGETAALAARIHSTTSWAGIAEDDIAAFLFPGEKRALALADSLVRRPGEIPLLELLDRADAASRQTLRERLARIQEAPFNEIRPEKIRDIASRLRSLAQYARVYRREPTAEVLQGSFSPRETALLGLFDATRRPQGEVPLFDLLLAPESAARDTMLFKRIQAFEDYKPDRPDEGTCANLGVKLGILLDRPQVNRDDAAWRRAENPFAVLLVNDVTDLPVAPSEWRTRVARRFGPTPAAYRPYAQVARETRELDDVVLSALAFAASGERFGPATHAYSLRGHGLAFNAEVAHDGVRLFPVLTNPAFLGAAEIADAWRRAVADRGPILPQETPSYRFTMMSSSGYAESYRLHLRRDGSIEADPGALRPPQTAAYDPKDPRQVNPFTRASTGSPPDKRVLMGNALFRDLGMNSSYSFAMPGIGFKPIGIK